MNKQFSVFLCLVLFLTPLVSSATFEENVIALLLFSGFNVTAASDCRSSSLTFAKCLEMNLFNDSTSINLTNLFEFDSANLTQVRIKNFFKQPQSSERGATGMPLC